MRPDFFWLEMFHLSRHEFYTRVEQTLMNRGHGDLTLGPVMAVAMDDYDQHWREKDEQTVLNSPT